MDKNASLHSRHRDRMRKKYLRFGAEPFLPHELLEMLLYHSIIRRDTNSAAHKLLYRFGSLEKILHAPVAELTETEEIGEKSALLLSLTGQVSRRAELDECGSVPLDSAFRQSLYLFNWYKGKAPGTVAAAMLDSKMRLIENVTLSAGRMFRPASYCKSITESAERLKASYVILSHSHENGVRKPSVEDVYLTGAIRSALGARGVELTEHYIVTATDCVPCTAAVPDAALE